MLFVAKFFYFRQQDTRGSLKKKNDKIKCFESLCLGGKCYSVCFNTL